MKAWISIFVHVNHYHIVCSFQAWYFCKDFKSIIEMKRIYIHIWSQCNMLICFNNISALNQGLYKIAGTMIAVIIVHGRITLRFLAKTTFNMMAHGFSAQALPEDIPDHEIKAQVEDVGTLLFYDVGFQPYYAITWSIIIIFVTLWTIIDLKLINYLQTLRGKKLNIHRVGQVTAKLKECKETWSTHGVACLCMAIFLPL